MGGLRKKVRPDQSLFLVELSCAPCICTVQCTCTDVRLLRWVYSLLMTMTSVELCTRDGCIQKSVSAVASRRANSINETWSRRLVGPRRSSTFYLSVSLVLSLTMIARQQCGQADFGISARWRRRPRRLFARHPAKSHVQPAAETPPTTQIPSSPLRLFRPDSGDLDRRVWSPL